MTCPNNIIIYQLKDPITNEIRYVGKTVQKLYNRYSSHISCSKYSRKPDYCHCWIKSLLNKDLKPKIEIIEYTNDINRETYWIKNYRELGYNLTNFTDGGDTSNLGCRWKVKDKSNFKGVPKKVYIFNSNKQLVKEYENILSFSKDIGVDEVTASVYCKKNIMYDIGLICSLINEFPKVVNYKLVRHIALLDDNKIIKIYKCPNKASKELNIEVSGICKVANKRMDSIKGYKFKYITYDDLSQQTA